jgi:hypothetical protein
VKELRRRCIDLLLTAMCALKPLLHTPLTIAALFHCVPLPTPTAHVTTARHAQGCAPGLWRRPVGGLWAASCPTSKTSTWQHRCWAASHSCQVRLSPCCLTGSFGDQQGSRAAGSCAKLCAACANTLNAWVHCVARS